MRLLDLFCGAGGAAVGYHRAGFTEIVGVDYKPMPRYPFEFVQSGAFNYLAEHGYEFDAIHSSPPCQRYSVSRKIHNSGDRHQDLVETCRALLNDTGRPWIMENVVNAPMKNCVCLCGRMFGLGVLRHRIFESSILLLQPEHPKHDMRLSTGAKDGYSTGEGGLVCVAGNNFVLAAASKAMGIDWMNRKELAQAIPPAYTEYLGKQLIAAIKNRAESES